MEKLYLMYVVYKIRSMCLLSAIALELSSVIILVKISHRKTRLSEWVNMVIYLYDYFCGSLQPYRMLSSVHCYTIVLYF